MRWGLTRCAIMRKQTYIYSQIVFTYGFRVLESLLIKGGRALNGSVRIGGAKNAALPVLISYH